MYHFIFFSKNPNGYQDVLVMDEDRIIRFDYHGNINDELIDNQIHRFRGLSHVTLEDGKITLVTTEKTRHALRLVFIDIDNLCNGVLRKMDINHGVYCPISFLGAKCVFVKANTSHIYVTDLGNGCILDTDTKFWTTK